MSSISPQSNSKELVTSVGTSWIICRSKSFGGRIYYFNTFTGNAVWNLSDTEMEKAKNTTTIFQSEPGYAIGDCPEPLESPSDESNKHITELTNKLGNVNQFSQQTVPPILFNKEIINNQSSKSSTQYSNHPMNFPTASSLNSALCNVASQQLFVTPTISLPQPVIHNNINHVCANKKAETLNNRFKKQSELHPVKTGLSQDKQFQTCYKKYECHQWPKSEVKIKDKTHIDLRLLLSLKRRENFINENESYQRSCAAATYLNDYHSETEQGDIYPQQPKRRSYSFSATGDDEDHSNSIQFENLLYKHSDTEQGGTNPVPSFSRTRSYSFNEKEGEDDNNDNIWFEHSSYKHTDTDQGMNMLPPPFSKRSSNLNPIKVDDDDNKWLPENCKSQGDTNPVEMEALRRLLHITGNLKVWYIVTDSNVLINNIHLLIKILHADKQCRLMVPQTVMTKIQSATNSRLRLLAHRALYFILQQVEASLAIIDENSEEIENSNNDIINCSIQLIKKGNRVVILTDDIELHNNNNASKIPTLTVAEINQLVKEAESHKALTKNLGTGEFHKGRNIKITIENETNTQHNEEMSVLATDKYVNPEMVLDEEMCEKPLSANKDACDVGVQADSVPLPKITDDICNELILPDSTKTNDNIPNNISEIQLKRYLSRELSSKTKNTKKKKVLRRHNVKSPSFSDNHAKVGGIASICPVTTTIKTTPTSTLNSTTNENPLFWGLYSHVSSDSLNARSFRRYDESSESSSLTLFRNVNPHEHVTIDETSTSGLSQTASIVDTASEKSGLQNMNKEDDKNVMFEVTDVRMEELLRTKSDEWVSRLVQIMEEALSQVLLLGPADALEHMPPPWTVHEATECIKKGFQNDPDIVDAANKFLRISLENGGLRGKIKSSITPHKYMELYSFAVYLIDALQGVLTDNEDLQTAAESLSKLLCDIQDSHSDLSHHNESLANDAEQEKEAKAAGDSDTNKAKVNTDDNNKKNKTYSPKRLKVEASGSIITSPVNYNLRSKRKSSNEVQQDASDNVTVIRKFDTETSFFSSLHLTKNSIATSNGEIASEMRDTVNRLRTSDVIEQKSPSPNLDKTNEDVNTSEEVVAKTLHNEPKINEPKIIRNFSICQRYEDKLKSKSEHIGAYRGLEQSLDDQEDFTEDYEDGEWLENKCYTDFNDDILLYEFGHIPQRTENEKNLENSKNAGQGTVTFKYFMEKLESDIRNAYSSIQNFCIQSCVDLQSSELSVEDNSQMQLRAEKTISYIHQMCDKLNSVLMRESSNTIFEILRRKEFKDTIIDDIDKEAYRNFISNCLEQANVLMASVTLVLKASKEQFRLGPGRR